MGRLVCWEAALKQRVGLLGGGGPAFEIRVEENGNRANEIALTLPSPGGRGEESGKRKRLRLGL